jgi:DNA/RNA-binding domain of Phe-tRNA-synthetase-like protein
MLTVTATDEWRYAHPGATIGLLELSSVETAASSSPLVQRKRDTEAHLRERYRGFTRQDFLALPVMAAYEAYYKRFHKTYHVLLQVESIVLRGKNLPDVFPLVDANFTAEVETLVLSAGHDVANLTGALCMDVAGTGEAQTQMNGVSKEILSGDMIMRDAGGICCSIIYGQDHRSPITAATPRVLYVAYAPAGVPAQLVEAHLRKVEENVRLFSPVVVEQLRLLRAEAG